MKKQQGFTLIELMIVVAIIAILAAIALPAYQDYLIKSRVSEVITAASSARTAVSEIAAAQTPNSMPADADVSLTPQSSKYVASVTYASNAIVATSRNLGGGVTGDIKLTGTKATNGQVDWVCSGTIPAQYRPGTCQ